MAKCLFSTICPRCPRFASGALVAPFARFAPLPSIASDTLDYCAQLTIYCKKKLGKFSVKKCGVDPPVKKHFICLAA